MSTTTDSNPGIAKPVDTVHPKHRGTAALIGYTVLVATCGGFPLGGHIYAHRLGLLGLLFLIGFIPVPVIGLILYMAMPWAGIVVFILWGLVYLLLPLHAMTLVPPVSNPTPAA